MSRRSLKKKRCEEAFELHDKQAMQYMQNYRRTKSYPEDLLRESVKRLSVHYNGDKETDITEDEEIDIARSYLHNKRLKSCGQLQSALVTLAIREGDAIQLWRLLARKDVDINHMDGLGMQPIHYACLYGELEILKILLQHNVDINSATKEGECGLDLAVKEGNFELAQYLVTKGAGVKSIMNGIRENLPLKQRPLSYSGTSAVFDSAQVRNKQYSFEI